MTTRPPSRRRPLTADEAELWAHAMRDAKAMRRRRKVESEMNGRSAEAMADSQRTASAPAPESKNGHKVKLNGLPSPPAAPSAPPLANFEDRHRRKLARNAEAIDARLDLHGMRQREAHGALRAFLFASAARGDRNILIITGKGVRADIERRRDYFEEERGVLRRLVPQWLSEPEFRAIVVSYTTAAIRHGGEGALYVRLRKLG